MPGTPQATQLAVIGGGPGGYAAAFLAADLGMQVTLIDQEAHPGGVCLYYGCIPSKALLHVAKVLEDARQAAHWGVTFAVDDADAIANKAAELGGNVVVPPFDAPWVRTTVIADPQGATFTASKFVPENKSLAEKADAAISGS